MAGVIYVCYGASLATLPSTPSRSNGLNLATNLMSLQGWGVVWVIVGCLALASTRWPPQSETWGYGAMSGMSSLWASFYLLGIPFRDGWASSVPGVLVFYLLAFMWWGISGLMNPDDPEPHKPVVFDWSIYAPSHRGRTPNPRE